jgi:hypothetical protein
MASLVRSVRPGATAEQSLSVRHDNDPKLLSTGLYRSTSIIALMFKTGAFPMLSVQSLLAIRGAGSYDNASEEKCGTLHPSNVVSSTVLT